MYKLLNILSERLAALLMALAFAITALIPLNAWAERPGEMDRDGGGGKPGARVGDPLDTNDADGDADDDVQDNHSIGSSRDDIWFQILASQRIVFVPQYNGTTLTFKVILLSDAIQVVEDSDAK